jgi:hypothetical protein
MNSLPVAFGVDKAKLICVASIDLTQLGVAAYVGEAQVVVQPDSTHDG